MDFSPALLLHPRTTRRFAIKWTKLAIFIVTFFSAQPLFALDQVNVHEGEARDAEEIRPG